jgi:hypothetical protein
MCKNSNNLCRFIFTRVFQEMSPSNSASSTYFDNLVKKAEEDIQLVLLRLNAKLSPAGTKVWMATIDARAGARYSVDICTQEADLRTYSIGDIEDRGSDQSV